MTAPDAASPAVYLTRRELRLAREAEERAVAEAAGDSTAEASPAATDSPEPVVIDAQVEVVASTAIPPVAAAPIEVVVEQQRMPSLVFEEPAALSAGADLNKRAAKRAAKAERAARAATAPRGRATASSAPKRSLRQRLATTGVMLIVGGLFASLALPSYASFASKDSGEGALIAQKDVSTQTLTVADGAATTTIAVDAYGAISAADLVKVFRTSARDANLAAYLQSGALEMGDDYPYATEPSRSQGGGLSPFRYYYRECVDFVAWRLNRDAGYTSAPYKWDWGNLTPGGGNASQWKSAWESKGWPTGSTPEAGAVAWFSYNHVAYVNKVNPDGTVLLEEYNWGSDHTYSQRTVAAGDVALYLYHPPA